MKHSNRFVLPSKSQSQERFGFLVGCAIALDSIVYSIMKPKYRKIDWIV